MKRKDVPPDGAACQVCGRRQDEVDLVPAAVVRPSIAERIRAVVPAWSRDGYICVDDLDRFRSDYVADLLRAESEDVASLERSVVEQIAGQEIVASDVGKELEKERSLGERVADRIAAFGGSWGFILLFASFLAAWMVLNSILLVRGAFDPFPYILLNLILSCLAAIQAPVIMMSQNRQEARDRRRSQNDYVVNLKAELEIRLLHEKIDHVLLQQWERLSEIQAVQIELMRELAHRPAAERGTPPGRPPP
jgi:uncharacterized membrane protein